MATTDWIIRASLFFVSSWSVLAATPGQVTIFIYDFAHIGSKTLKQAETLASSVFVRAGLNAHWTTEPSVFPTNLLTDFTAVAGGRCTTPLRSAIIIRAQILSQAPNGFASQALGFSLPCAERGVQVTIYADRVEAVSQHTLAAFYRVLGYGLAHELGHVLLRSPAHEESGLMKAVWSKADWQGAAVRIIPFTPDQAREMADSLLRSESFPCSTVKTSARTPDIQGTASNKETK